MPGVRANAGHGWLNLLIGYIQYRLSCLLMPTQCFPAESRCHYPVSPAEGAPSTSRQLSRRHLAQLSNVFVHNQVYSLPKHILCRKWIKTGGFNIVICIQVLCIIRMKVQEQWNAMVTTPVKQVKRKESWRRWRKITSENEKKKKIPEEFPTKPLIVSRTLSWTQACSTHATSPFHLQSINVCVCAVLSHNPRRL